MKRGIPHLIGIFCMLLLGGSAFGQVNVSMDLDSTVIFIGDHLGLTINIAAPTNTTIKNVNYGKWADAGKVELLDLGNLNTITTSPELLLQQRLVFTTFDSGYHRLPSLEVIYELNGIQDTARSSNLGLTVATIPVQEDADIMANKDIIKEPIKLVDFLPIVLALLVIVVIIGVIWRASAVRKRKAMPPAPLPPPIPAHIIALEKLDQLEAAAAWKTGDSKGFQSDLTYILREYLENRYDLQALEATSPEIIKDLQRLKLDEKGSLRAVLETADLVKFAKATPAEAVHVQSLNQVRTFVTTTKYTPPANEPLADVNEEEE
ncbi:hypothetical protein [Lewinella sp. LCG006]|uniref:hypothetical protein n=1 Tax=Lewinella sp. LCG006 TaxID=3231911 RepID=UPI003461494B